MRTLNSFSAEALANQAERGFVNMPANDQEMLCPPDFADLFSACGLDFEDVGYDWLDVIVMVALRRISQPVSLISRRAAFFVRRGWTD